MTDTLTPVERTNWALSTWNSTLDWNDVPSAWLYGRDHLWRGARHWQEYRRTSELKYGIWNLHKFCFRVRTCISVYYLIRNMEYNAGIWNTMPIFRISSTISPVTGPPICGQLRTSCLHLGSFGLLPPHPPHPSPPSPPPTHPPPASHRPTP